MILAVIIWAPINWSTVFTNALDPAVFGFWKSNGQILRIRQKPEDKAIRTPPACLAAFLFIYRLTANRSFCAPPPYPS